MYRLTLKKRLLIASSSGLLIFTAGCATPYKSISSEGSTKTGMLYSLPKAQVKLTAKRQQVSEEDLAEVDKSLIKLKTEIENIKTALLEAKKLERNAKAAQARAKESVKKKADENFELAQSLVKGLEDMKKVDEAELKDSEIHRKVVLANQGKWEETITIVPLSVAPENNRRYLLDLDHNIFRNDALDVTVENGLLSSSKATSDDQTKNIILSLVQGFSAFKTPKGLGEENFIYKSKVNDSNIEECNEYFYQHIFNPTDTTETQAVIAALKGHRAGVTFKLDHVFKQLISPTTVKEVDGIVYRAPLNLGITLYSDEDAPAICGGTAIKQQETIVMTVPDPDAEFILMPRAGAFTKSQFDFTFKDGSPSKYTVDRPSEVAGIASLPIDIAKALISIPAEIIRLRVDYDSKANSAIEAKTAEYKAQIDLLKAKKELQDEKKKGDENP